VHTHALNNIYQNKKNAIVRTDFYQKEKIDAFKKDMAARLNAVFTKSDPIEKYDFTSDGLKGVPKTVRMEREVDVKNILIPKRSSMLISSSNDHVTQMELDECSNSGYHYMTYNNIILVYDPIHVAFDLMRSKINVSCSGSFQKNGKDTTLLISSEFIDISIPKWRDTGRDLFLDHGKVYDMSYVDGDMKVNIVACDMEELRLGVQYVLFTPLKI
jgi:hypothetical protein